MNSSRATSVTDKQRLWFSYLITRRPSTLPTIPPHSSYWRFCCEANSDILLLADADNADPSAAAGGVPKSTNDRLARDKRRVLSSDNPLKSLKPETLTLNVDELLWMANPGRTKFPVLFSFFFLLLPKSSFLRYVASEIFFFQILDVASLPKGI